MLVFVLILYELYSYSKSETCQIIFLKLCVCDITYNGRQGSFIHTLRTFYDFESLISIHPFLLMKKGKSTAQYNVCKIWSHALKASFLNMLTLASGRTKAAA